MSSTSTPHRVALAGNPNSGKTTLFNALTGSRAHVGNYPGVTVERREGGFELQGSRFTVVDLPGTYSLSSFTPEERVAQQELLEGQHELVVLVVDATTLKRSLVLLAQLRQIGARLVLCLNMSDEAQRAGQRLDLGLLEQLLGHPVVQTAAHRGQGVAELRAAILQATTSAADPQPLPLGPRLQPAIDAVAARMQGLELPGAQLPWLATKLLLDEPTATRRVGALGGEQALQCARRERQRLEQQQGEDIAVLVTAAYFGYVDGLLHQVVQAQTREDARLRSDRVDAVLAHRVLGLPFFFAVMYGIFWLTFTVGEIPMGWIESGFAQLGSWVSSLWPSGSDSPLRSLLADGIIAGVGGVLVFLPNIVLLFLCLALVEDTGYMARAAFLMDRLMHRFGLHGRSFVPMVVGLGCTVPGIMATRTLEHEHDRLTTMLVLPLVSCGARMTIWMLLVPAFFAPSLRAPVLWSIYLVGVLLALVVARLLRGTLLKGEEAPFVMELPPYRLPTLRAVRVRMMERSWLYLRKAGTVILAISIVMWLLTSYPKAQVETAADGRARVTLSGQQRRAADLRHSIAGRIGRAMEPALAPLGLDWKVGTAMVGAFAAKEVFVAQLGIIYAVGDAESTGGAERLRQLLQHQYSPAAAYALMLFLLIATPCMATVAITRRESGRWRWALLQLGGLTLLGYLVALAFYQLSRLFVG